MKAFSTSLTQLDDKLILASLTSASELTCNTASYCSSLSAVRVDLHLASHKITVMRFILYVLQRLQKVMLTLAI